MKQQNGCKKKYNSSRHKRLKCVFLGTYAYYMFYFFMLLILSEVIGSIATKDKTRSRTISTMEGLQREGIAAGAFLVLMIYFSYNFFSVVGICAANLCRSQHDLKSLSEAMLYKINSACRLFFDIKLLIYYILSSCADKYYRLGVLGNYIYSIWLV